MPPLLRAIFGVIVGYIAMALVVFVTFTTAFIALGTEGAFEEGSYEVTVTWLVLSFALGLVAAIAGGLVCALIARRGSRAPVVLAGIVLVLGLVMAVPVLMTPAEERPQTRGPEVTTTDAMMNARQPAITLLLNPVVGAVGVMIGARLRGGGGKATG